MVKRKKWLLWGLTGFCAALLLYVIQQQLLSNDSWSTWSLPLTGKIIVLDAGHGGVDGGAVGKGDVQEKDIALNISLKLRDYLQQAGALVIMTRETDRDLANDGTKRIRNRKTEDLLKRTEIVNSSEADMFISIHLNAIPSSRWYGAQVFYNPAIEENEKLAKLIQDQIRSNLENTTRKAKPISTVYMVRKAEIPGSLVEVGFLSNPNERELLKSKLYQTKLAASIYQGILRFYANEPAPGD
ncbi:N-acetylmuramoyl-L-alanine amidase CwlD [Pseudalkalibacillus salsuginis]|uniref:N-acetylmuramoyl-L-alanine amidase CwlD n=1 Tax=Pseudalkalibacillus salsuginis TaxID=2910972 RepID=UPI001F19A88A|nr:N-acetylmuramoyl-L-alanine amidase CwlD [Pseudalkalibacillus salsuginis]MCF6411818.1 N-acetylmuramoyl-L-alanine amidase CwlD [Pseudalkalibacillus salsuginis]